MQQPITPKRLNTIPPVTNIRLDLNSNKKAFDFASFKYKYEELEGKSYKIANSEKVKTKGAPTKNSRKKSISEHIQLKGIRIEIIITYVFTISESKEKNKPETRSVTASKRKFEAIMGGTSISYHEVLNKKKLS